MPFLSTSSTIFRRRGPASRLHAVVESVLVVACDEYVTLNAIVIGDATGHTFFWEQLSGPAVNWLEAQNQTSVMFQQPSNRADKTFRFYIDRGTPLQAIYDILVTAVPKETVQIPASFTTSYDGAVAATAELASNLRTIPGLSPYGVVTVNNPLRGLGFTSPTNVYAASTVVMRRINGIFVPVSYRSDVQYSDTYFNIVPDASYRVDTIKKSPFSDPVQIAGTEYVSYASKTDNSVIELDTSDDVRMSSIGGPEIAIVERFVRELATLNGTEETTVIFSGFASENESVIVERFVRELIGMGGVPDEDATLLVDFDARGLGEILEVKPLDITTIG